MPDLSPEEIAGKLTKAQREAILSAEAKIDGDPESLFLRPRRDGGALIQSLYDAGLVGIVMRGAMLNSLGLQVRAILEQKP